MITRFLSLMMMLALCGVSITTIAAGPAATQPASAADPVDYLSDVHAQLRAEWPKNRTVNIVCHGHSVPAGYGKTPVVHMLDAYPHLLQEGICNACPTAVVNVIVTAIGGENSEAGEKRFQKDVLSLHPDVVTIDYALNDRSIGLDRAKTAWVSMIHQAQDAHVKIILMTPTADTRAKLDDPNDPLNQHAEQIRHLSAEFHVGLVDSLAAFKQYVKDGGTLADLMAQSNHPNRKGHELVVAELMKWFKTEK